MHNQKDLRDFDKGQTATASPNSKSCALILVCSTRGVTVHVSYGLVCIGPTSYLRHSASWRQNKGKTGGGPLKRLTLTDETRLADPYTLLFKE